MNNKIQIRYSPDKIKAAEEYNRTSGRIMIIPTSHNLVRLEKLWELFNSQHKQLKREADWKSLELFGLNNQDHYEYLRSKYSDYSYDKIKLPDPTEVLVPSDTCVNTNLFELANIRSKDINDSIVHEADEDWTVKFKQMVEKDSKENNIKLFPRIGTDPIDGSEYQKFVEEDKVSNKVDVTKLIDENTYVVSDLHLGREKVFDEKIISFINRMPEDGVLLILGDIGHRKNFDQEYLTKRFSRIKCKNIFLVLGNHDLYSLDYYYSLGIKGIYEKILIPEKKWIFSHQPCDGPGLDWTNFHGHIHEETEYYDVKDVRNKINCYYRYFDCPKKISELILWNKNNNIKKSISENRILYNDEVLLYENKSSSSKLNMSSFEYGCILLENTSDFNRDLFKLNLSLYKTENFSERMKKEKIITKESNEINIKNYYPALPPDELLELGVFGNDNYYSDYKALKISSDFTSKDWFDSYQKVCMGVMDENYYPLSIARNHMLTELCYKLSKDPDNNQLKQWILELGWNPEVPYTTINKNLMSKSTQSKLNNFYNEFSFIDVQGIENVDYLEETSDVEEKELYPVYIVLLSSKTNFGKIIKKVTDSIWTHGAVSFDTKMNIIYSYDREGFTYDSFDKYGKDAKVSIYTVFLNRKDYIKIKTRLDYFIANKKHTKYGIGNLLNVIVGKVKKHDLNLICTEFVDKLFKYVGIDITHKSSNLVTPEDVSKSAKSNKKVYLVYEGYIGSYDRNKVDKRVEKLKISGKVFRELFTDQLCESIVDKYIIEPIIEVKEFPIQFDKEGNLLIKNIKKINYNEEYNKSHKLLKEYEKSGNIEGMKYEISKLWFMYHLLEKIKHEKNLSKNELKAVNDSRARIYNDFQKYLDIIHSKEKDFNFNEYYEESPFSDSAYKFRASTLKFTKDFIKSLII